MAKLLPYKQWGDVFILDRFRLEFNFWWAYYGYPFISNHIENYL